MGSAPLQGDPGGSLLMYDFDDRLLGMTPEYRDPILKLGVVCCCSAAARHHFLLFACLEFVSPGLNRLAFQNKAPASCCCVSTT